MLRDHLLLTATLVLAFAVAPVKARAADEERRGPQEEVRFDSADGVELYGTFHPGGRGKKSPCVLLLHDLGSHSQQASWEHFATELQKDGLSVLRFDFRGHGRSVAVDEDVFWQVPANRQMVRGYSRTNPPEAISAQDFGRGYHPMLANDVAAARLYLDRRNDAGDCNSSTLIVVGAGEGATLGAMWVASECYRHQALGEYAERLESSPEGKAIATTIWLSVSPTLQQRRMPVIDWAKVAARDNRMPAAFLSGDRDETALQFAQQCATAIKGRDGGMELTAARGVRQTNRSGEALLYSRLETVGLIRNYIRNVLEDRGADEWVPRRVQEQTYFWVFRGARPIVAKAERERDLRLLPVHALGAR